MKKNIFKLVLILVIANTNLFSQNTFVRKYGNSAFGYSLVPTNDNGYLIAGYTTNMTTSTSNLYLIKTDVNGDTLWTKIYGGTDGIGYSAWGGGSVISSMEGGYLFAGLNCCHPATSAYLLKIDSVGNVQWSNNYGTFDTIYPTEAFSVMQKPNGNYLFTGFADNYFSGIGERVGILVGEVNQNGNYLGNKVMGDTMFTSKGYCIREATNGFIVSGYNSDWNPISGTTPGAALLKFDDLMNLQWQVCLDSIAGNGSTGYSAVETSDGGFVMTGTVDLDNGDIFLLKTNASGIVQWLKLYSAGAPSAPHALIATSDNGFLIFGESATAGQAAIKTDSSGNIQWQKLFFGSGAIGTDVKQTSNGDFIFCGYETVGLSHDITLVKTDSLGNTCMGFGNPGFTQKDTMLITDARIYPINIPTSSNTLFTAANRQPDTFDTPCLITGIKQPMQKNMLVKIFPTPFSTKTVLQTDTPLKNATLTVENVFGQTVEQITPITIEAGQTVTLFRNNLPSGLYFVRLTEGNQIISENKFIITE